jgi:hypothetical protein
MNRQMRLGEEDLLLPVMPFAATLPVAQGVGILPGRRLYQFSRAVQS